MTLNQKIKIAIWHLLVLILAFGFWQYIDYVLNVISPDSWSFDFGPLALLNFIILVSVLALGGIFFSWLWALTLTAVWGLVFLLFFGFNFLNLLGVVVAMLLSLESFRSINQEMAERLKINPSSALRRGLPNIILPFLLLISFASYQSPVVQNLEKMETIPSVGVTFMRNIIETTLGPRIKIEDPNDRNLIFDQLTQETSGQLNTLLKPYFRYAPPVLSLAVFLVLFGVSWIFVWAGVGIGALLFKILRLAKFWEKEEKDGKIEVLKI